MKKIFLGLIVVCSYLYSTAQVLQPEQYKKYIDDFNINDEELYRLGDYPNEMAWEFLARTIPLFDCPDKQLEKNYYFRWWTYRKHIRKTTDGYIITEFLPDVGWAGKHNSIACPAAHHFMEGRWLRDPLYLQEYARFWFTEEATPRSYSFWPAYAITEFTKVHPDETLLKELFIPLEENYQAWEKEKRDSSGLFWQYDNRDGMELSISGSYAEPHGYGYRATINSYMYGEAEALAKIASLRGDHAKAAFYRDKATGIKDLINGRLWDNIAEFYKVIPYGSEMVFSDVREQHGYTPWYFNIPPANYSVAWKFLMDRNYFYAPYGITTAEQSHPRFAISYEGHECLWDGPVWPFATSITLTALANLLHNYDQAYITKRDYYELLIQYSRSHSIMLDDGRNVSWIDENMNPYTGEWIARSRLKGKGWPTNNGGRERGKDYNHSTFIDLVISGLIGICPSEDQTLVIDPLIPENYWEYFCLDNLLYQGKNITVYYDKTGNYYNKGKGYFILIDGKEAFHDTHYKKCRINLP